MQQQFYQAHVIDNPNVDFVLAILLAFNARAFDGIFRFQETILRPCFLFSDVLIVKTKFVF
ncbi:MAG: hypothetical protein LBP85_03395 [Prevotellaceae bacterium]|jgi:hypothetical protein|nr:hypothetical protein [Prevotellaceae bacterium]